LYSITRESSNHIIVLSGDHVYKMDYAKMLRFHIERNADATIALTVAASSRAVPAVIAPALPQRTAYYRSRAPPAFL